MVASCGVEPPRVTCKPPSHTLAIIRPAEIRCNVPPTVDTQIVYGPFRVHLDLATRAPLTGDATFTHFVLVLQDSNLRLPMRNYVNH